MEKVKNNAVWVVLTIASLLFAGLLVVGITTARADGGTCKVKILDKCVVDWAQDLRDVQDELDELGLTEPEDADFVLGAVVGPETTFDHWGVGGVNTWYTQQGLNNSTSSACVLRSPRAATSTLLLDGSTALRVDVSSTTALEYGLYKGATAFATTTIIGQIFDFVATDRGSVIATATIAQAQVQDQVFGPGEFLIFEIRNGITGADDTTGYLLSGSCQAVWVQN